MSKSRGILAKRQYWTAEQIAVLESRYPNEKTELIAADIGRELRAVYQKALALGLKKSAEYLATPAAGRTNGRQGIGSRFKKGQTPWNKDVKGLDIGGKETRFKPGHKPLNTWKPIGAERNSDGYLYRKVADTGVKKVDWVMAHIQIWEQHNGTVPSGHAVIFKDGNRKHIEIDNLECISRAELMNRNTIHRLPKELAEVCQLRGALTRQINKRLSK